MMFQDDVSNNFEFTDQIKRLESSRSDTYKQDFDPRIPQARNVRLFASAASGQSTEITIVWIRPDDTNIERFEIWVNRTVNTNPEPYLAASVVDSPAEFIIKSDAAAESVAWIRTVMKNGLTSSLTNCPTVTFDTF